MAIALVLACAMPLVAQAASGPVAPKATTGGATAVRGSSATLAGIVDPGGAATSYSFQYGPTIAYGKQTSPGQLPAGTTKVKVGQPVTGLVSGYHYRLVATNSVATAYGKDRTFGVKNKKKATQNRFTLPKTSAPTVYGSTYVLSGTLSGAGNVNRAVVLQASPYPFLEAFAAVGAASHTTAAGRFSFRVPNMTKTTQFRVSTLDPRPLYSRVVTQDVGVKVTLRVRSSGHRGLVRLFGTVTPARPGARVDFQLFKAVRPGRSEKTEERTGRFSTQFSTIVKRGTPTVSRFSSVVTVQRGGSYRAYVDLRSKLAVGPGFSHTLLLHAAPSSTTKRR
ncbi:MAG TPA: hypothetical protein VH025_01745 [Solirubrobacteraceae bacterium]|nr:hypothetical protein [Solirubrobacteraceae bacterium]